MYSKTCLQGTPQYPRESVPTWQVSLRHRFLNMGKIGHHSDKVSPAHRVSSYRSVPWRQVLLYMIYGITSRRKMPHNTEVGPLYWSMSYTWTDHTNSSIELPQYTWTDHTNSSIELHSIHVHKWLQWSLFYKIIHVIYMNRPYKL